MLKKVFVFLLFIALILITEIIVFSVDKIRNDNRLSLVVADLNKAMELIFNGALISSEVLKEYVKVSGDNNITREKFEQISQELLKSHSQVDSILLLPNGVVSYVYPHTGNENAIGYNVLSDENRKRGSMEAISKDDVIIIGPLKLVENNKPAFLVRRTIRNSNGFWGVSTSVVYLETILSTIESVVSKHGIEDYYIAGYNPDTQEDYEKIIISKGDVEKIELLSVVNIFNTKWQFSISKINTESYVKIFLFLSLLGFLLLFLLPSIRYCKKYEGSEREKRILENDAYTDYLTGLSNRRGFEHRISHLDTSVTNGSVAIFDIDFFKKINDTHGHDVGDSVLVGFANLCKMHISDSFVLSRSGGEEFILLMPLTKIEDAKVQCERLKIIISKEKFTLDTAVIGITMSVGLAFFTHTKDIKVALTLADKALYRAKQEGRDRVCIG
ncbi:sensor domain-containing diguanylate cyclase [Shewanella pneumatophori]|uniref:diguanylate cyclase n=1 Tax=Shewanella pneumatophori TaxID=314092 RepID=A0A9X1ZGU1_9GAMM|nr:sensor domain-containing diguanylate cyclase [Shewanella pneumatophori]MCL1139725.1 sensor domain-containing diguanylate cyclase [Shewanella pneumatophori]